MGGEAGKSRIRAQGIESRVDGDKDHPTILLVIGSFEKVQRMCLVAGKDHIAAAIHVTSIEITRIDADEALQRRRIASLLIGSENFLFVFRTAKQVDEPLALLPCVRLIAATNIGAAAAG